MISGIDKCRKQLSNPDENKQWKKILGEKDLINKIHKGESKLLQYCKNYTRCSRKNCNNIEGTIYEKTEKLPYDYNILDKCIRSKKTIKNCNFYTTAKSSKKGKEIIDEIENCCDVTCKDDYNNYLQTGKQLTPLYKKMFSKMKKYTNKMKKTIKKNNKKTIKK